MEAPEFDLFKRIENLEQRTEGQLTTRDASILSLLGFEMAYMAMSWHVPQSARKYKDDFLGKLKRWSFNKEWLGIIEEDLVGICELVEQTGKVE